MDPYNERMIFRQVVQAATRPGLPQYFLITPKLLPDLDYTPSMTILCVYNGPWQFTQEGTFCIVVSLPLANLFQSGTKSSRISSNCTNTLCILCITCIIENAPYLFYLFNGILMRSTLKNKLQLFGRLLQ